MDTTLRATLETELEGILVIAVRGLQRLIARNGFGCPPSVMEALQTYRLESDTARQFVAEECRLDPDAWVDRAILARHYRLWCQDGGEKPLSGRGFNRHLQDIVPGIARRKRAGRPGWLGLTDAQSARAADGSA